MLMAFVPDASIAAASVLPGEEAALADLALDRLGAETAEAPGRSGTSCAIRSWPPNVGVGSMSAAPTPPWRGCAVFTIACAGETDDREVMAPARTHRPTAYDAIYLALAIREGCALASLDRRLNEAAAAEGVAPFA